MVTRERWGTFSVKDHLRPQAFVSELLLFDRLVIPYPADASERGRWHDRGWDPDRQDIILDLLGDKAVRYGWNEAIYNSKIAANRYGQFRKAEIQDARQFKMDPFDLTRQALADDELARHQDDRIKVWTLPAFSSKQAFIDYNAQTPGERKTQLAAVVANKFLTPNDPGKPYEELLKDTLALSNDVEFLRKRQALNEWQEDILKNEMTTHQAVYEMETRLQEYNKLVKKASTSVLEKVVFLALEVGLGLAGAKLGAPLESASAMVSVAKFWKFERKPEIDSSDPAFVASMIYEARESLKFGD